VTRRDLLINLGTMAAAVAVGGKALAAGQATKAKTPIAVYKDPYCGCCGKWVEHMAANGFAPNVTVTDMGPIRAKYKVGNAVASCHTSVIEGYVIEGHVPASDVRALLVKKPKGIVGITIPGMPPSAPGMDLQPFQPYTVLTFDA